LDHGIPGEAKPEAVVAAVGVVVPEDVSTAEGCLEGDVRAEGSVVFLEKVVVAAGDFAVRRAAGEEEAIAPETRGIAPEDVPAGSPHRQETGSVGSDVSVVAASPPRLEAAAIVGDVLLEATVAGPEEMKSPAAVVTSDVA